MFIDGEMLFSDAQAITADAASTNLMDLGVAQRRLGTGNNIYCALIVDVALTDAGSTSFITVTMEQDDSSSFGSATAIQTLFVVPALSAIGAKFIARLAPSVITERYIRLKYTMTNGDLTTGTVTAFLTDTVDDTFHYADARTLDPQ